MLEERFGTRTSIPEEVLQRLIEILEKTGLELGNIWINGQPAPDAIFGTLKAPVQMTADLVKSFVDLRLRCDFFPYGIPAVDSVLINFGTPQQFGR